MGKPRMFHVRLLPNFKEELTVIAYNLFQKRKKSGETAKQFYEGGITLISKRKKIKKIRQLYLNISPEHGCKKSSTNILKFNAVIYPNQVDFVSGMQH